MDSIASLVFAFLATKRFPAYSCRVIETAVGPFYFCINGRYSISHERGIETTGDLEALYASKSVSVTRAAMLALVNTLPNKDQLIADWKKQIDSYRAKYNTGEKRENEYLEKYRRGLFRLRRYSNWEYPFVVGIPKRFHGGKRGRKFFQCPEEAETYIQDELSLASRVREEVLQMPEADRLMVHRSREKLLPFGKTIDDAVTYYVSFLKNQTASIDLKTLTKEFVTARIKDGISDAHLDNIESVSRIFQRAKGNVAVATITSKMLDDYFRGLTGTNSTRNHHKSALSSIFTYALAQGHIAVNPARLAMQAKPAMRQAPGILTVDQMRAVLTNADRLFLPMFVLGGFAGLRRSEIERLTWGDINWEKSIVEVLPPNKVNQHRYVKMLPNLIAWLLPFKDSIGMVCPGDMDWQIETVCEKAKIEKWPHNCLRHTYASCHLAHFRDPQDLMLELGHKSTETLIRHYRQAVVAEQGKAWFEIVP